MVRSASFTGTPSGLLAGEVVEGVFFGNGRIGCIIITVQGVLEDIMIGPGFQVILVGKVGF